MSALFLMLLRQHGIPTPVTELTFAPPRRWKFDWSWPDARLAVEVEGGIYGRGPACRACGRRRGGAHSSVTGIKRDIEKYNVATLAGWRVLRVAPDQLVTMDTIRLIEVALGLEVAA